jgi:hypothetical protein
MVAHLQVRATAESSEFPCHHATGVVLTMHAELRSVREQLVVDLGELVLQLASLRRPRRSGLDLTGKGCCLLEVLVYLATPEVRAEDPVPDEVVPGRVLEDSTNALDAIPDPRAPAKLLGAIRLPRFSFGCPASPSSDTPPGGIPYERLVLRPRLAHCGRHALGLRAVVLGGLRSKSILFELVEMAFDGSPPLEIAVIRRRK